MTGKSAFAPLASRPFRRFYFGRLSSLMGSSLVNVALAFAVLHLSDSAGAVGLVLAARTIPMISLILFGGVISDRLSRSLVLTVSHLCSGLTQGLAAVLLLTGHAQLWHLVVIEALNGAVSAFTQPALSSVTPQLVPAGELHAAAVLLSMSRNATRIVGPVIAAVIVAVGNPGWALAVDAAAYLLAAAFMVTLRLPGREPSIRSSMVQDLIQGWREFRALQWVWVSTASFFVINLLFAIVILTLGPVITGRSAGVGAWGAALSAQAAGLLVAAVVLMGRRLERPLRGGMVAITLMALPMVALAVAPHTVVLIITFFIAGVGLEVFDVGWTVATQEKIPTDQLSRVLSYDMLGALSAVPLGAILAGPLSDLWGESQVAMSGGILLVLTALSALLVPSVRNLRSEPA